MAEWIGFSKLPPVKQNAILDGPAMPPPKGVTANFNNPTNNNVLGIAFYVVCTTLIVFSTLVRLYARVILRSKIFIEDVLCIIAVGSFGAFSWAYFSWGHNVGFYGHQYEVRVRDLLQGLRSLQFLSLGYCFVMLFTRTAILAEWIRIFVPAGTRNHFWWGCLAMAGINGVFYLLSICLQVTSCIPLEKQWKPWLSGKCFDIVKLDIAATYINLALDILIILLPQRLIWRLQMTTKTKLKVAVVFSFGILILVTAIGRVQSIYAIKEDTVYTTSPLLLWSLSECTCVILVLNIPAFPHAFRGSWIVTFVQNSLASLTPIVSKRGASGNNSETDGKQSWGQFHELDDITPANRSSETTNSIMGSGGQGTVKGDGKILRSTEIVVQREVKSGESSERATASSDR